MGSFVARWLSNEWLGVHRNELDRSVSNNAELVLEVLLTCSSESQLDPTVYYSPICWHVDLAESWIPVRRENHRPKAALASVSDILSVDEDTNLTEHLLAEDLYDLIAVWNSIELRSSICIARSLDVSALDGYNHSRYRMVVLFIGDDDS